MPSETEIPIPIIHYLYLIQNKKSPYYDIVKHMVKDMEFRYQIAKRTEIVYTISPRQLQNDLRKEVESEKITTITICRSILAILYGCPLEQNEDYDITTSLHGRRKYHVKLNPRNLALLKGFV